jgi:hypothetical protein
MKIAGDLSIPINAVIMKDELPHETKFGNYIINLQSTTQGNGTHWTALIVQPDTSFYFDSFGELPSEETISFCREKSKHLYFNNWTIHDLKSELCGFY